MVRASRDLGANPIDEFTKVQELVYELKIEQVMTTSVVTVTPDTMMPELMDVLRLNRISGCPVVDKGALVGVISIEDVIKVLTRGGVEEVVRDRMTSPVITVNAHDSVIEAVKKFSQSRVGRLPVVNKDKALVGILTSGDITRGLLRAIQLDYHAEEISKYRASHIFEDIVSDQTSLILRYKVRAKDFDHGGEASSKIKRALERLGGQPQIVRRVAIAAYEAEMNVVIHTDRGGRDPGRDPAGADPYHDDRLRSWHPGCEPGHEAGLLHRPGMDTRIGLRGRDGPVQHAPVRR